MKKYIPLGYFALSAALILGVHVNDAKAIVPSEAEAIAKIVNLPEDKITFIRAITTPNVQMNIGNYEQTPHPTFKAGQVFEFDWNAPSSFKKVGILLKKANGELEKVIRNGDMDVAASSTQKFDLSLSSGLTEGFYYVTIYPVPLTGALWNTGVFKVTH